MGNTSVAEFEVQTGDSFMAAASDAQSGSESEEKEAEAIEEESDESAAQETQEASDEDEDTEGEESDTEQEPEESSEPKAKSKTYSLTMEDGAQVKVQDDATLKIKVDGSYKRVSVSDLVRDYNGQIKYDELIRRSAESEKEAKTQLDAIKAEDEQLREQVKSLSSAISEGGVMEALAVIAEMEGSEPEKIIDSWVNGLTTFLTEWSGLDGEQREDKVKRFKLNNEVKQLEAKRSKLSAQQQKEATEKAIQQAIDTYGVTRDQIQEAYHALAEYAKRQDKDPDSITLSEVVSTAMEFESMDHLVSAGEDLGVELDDSDVRYLVSMSRAQEQKTGTRLSKDDYVKLIKAYAKEEIESLSRKVEAPKRTTTPKSKEDKEIEVTRTSQIWD